MGRKTETDEQKVKKVYPDAECRQSPISYEFIIWHKDNIIGRRHEENAAWSDALRQINAAKRKKYYKRKITRPNGEIKVKVTIMLYPSDRTAIIEQYGSVQKFINTIVEQLKTK